MRGHVELIALRRQTRMKPPFVLVTVAHDPSAGWKWWHQDGGYPEVEIGPDDRIEALDLRWVHGLKVAVIGDDPDRTVDFVIAAQQCKPEVVWALVGDEYTEVVA